MGKQTPVLAAGGVSTQRATTLLHCSAPGLDESWPRAPLPSPSHATFSPQGPGCLPDCRGLRDCSGETWIQKPMHKFSVLMPIEYYSVHEHMHHACLYTLTQPLWLTLYIHTLTLTYAHMLKCTHTLCVFAHMLTPSLISTLTYMFLLAHANTHILAHTEYTCTLPPATGKLWTCVPYPTSSTSSGRRKSGSLPVSLSFPPQLQEGESQHGSHSQL